MSHSPALQQSEVTSEALAHRLKMAELRFGVMAHLLPGFGLQELADGCAKEAAAIRKLLQRVPA